MAKSKTKSVFSCQSCGAQRSRWEGRCSDCGGWNTFVEEKTTISKNSRSWLHNESPTGRNSAELFTLDQRPEDEKLQRWTTGLAEMDRVLGGGLVQGGFVLLGGAPGIGKSTLLMQMAGGLSQQLDKILYVTAEESVSQTAHRAHRLGVKAKTVSLMSESRMETILEVAQQQKPQVLILDSIQTVYLEELQTAPGTVSQVRECAARLLVLAKTQGISVFLIGHITKDGNIAGPKVLEHMVDCVLAFEGESSEQFRLLRTIKNRYGAAHELGVFTMAGHGLKEVSNPSEIFLEEKRDSTLGSSVFASVEGTRPLLCEIQALTVSTPMPMPRRTTVGIETNRLHLLLAVVERHLNLTLSNQDVYVNVVGGLRLEEPSCGLAVISSILSSHYRQELPLSSVFIGEVGLTGEVRATSFIENRLKEAAKLGFKNVFLPHSNQKHVQDLSLGRQLKLHWIKHIRELPQILFPKSSKHPQTKKADSRNQDSLDL